MRDKEYRLLCSGRGLNKIDTQLAIKYVQQFEVSLAEKNKSLENMSVNDVKEYVAFLISQGNNTWDRLVALARYSYMIEKHDVYVYFTSILGGKTIFPSLAERLESVAGEEMRDKIFKDLVEPPLGAPPGEYPKVTKRLVEKLVEELSTEVCHDVLAGNHHRIPVENFENHKTWLKEEGSIENYLKRAHKEAVADLEKHLLEGKIWFEQEITPEIVNFVKENQEILSGVRKDDWIYLTKIPYAPKDYLRENDPLLKRYYACHCPLAREAIMLEDIDIPLTWCYCSGGYGKLKFDIIFDEPTGVEVLESVLSGDERCRFRVKIPIGMRRACNFQ